MPTRKNFTLFYRPPHDKEFRSLEMYGPHYTDATARDWAKKCFPDGVVLYTSMNSKRETIKR